MLPLTLRPRCPGAQEAPLKPCVVAFVDYFGRFSIHGEGDCIRNRYYPPPLESKIGSKGPKNRLKPFTRIGSGESLKKSLIVFLIQDESVFD